MSAPVHDTQPPGKGRLAEAATCLLVFVLSLLAYLRTMRPSFGWGDSSELITAAYHLGVGHSPGYPTWMLIAHPFSRLPIGDVAFRLNLLNALLAGLAVALLYLLFRWLSGSRIAALVGALSFAFSLTWWDVTTEAEVYTLHICLSAAILLVALRWRREPRAVALPVPEPADRWLFLGSWMVGLSLGNHALTTLVAVSLLYLVWAERGWRFFRGRRLAVCVGLFLLGLSVYAYVPLRALANPPPQLNNPRTLGDFWTHLTAPGAREAMFDSGLRLPLRRAVGYLLRLTLEFGHAGCALALVGLVVLWRRDRRLANWLLLLAALDLAYSSNFSIFDIYVYYLPLYLVLAAFISVGAGAALDLAARGMARLRPLGVRSTPTFQRGPAAALLLMVPFTLFAGRLPTVDRSGDWSPELFARAVFRQVEPGALIMADWWKIAPLGYLKHIEGERPDVTLSAAPSLHCEQAFLEVARADRLRRYPAVYFAEALTYRADLIRARFPVAPAGPLWRVYVKRPPADEVLAAREPLPRARFADRVGLVDVELEGIELRPGACLDFTVYWTPLEGYNGRPHTAIYLLEGRDGERVWQVSTTLGHGLYPADRWRPGEVVREPHRIYLPDAVPAGEYDLKVRVREQGCSAALPCEPNGLGAGGRDCLLARLTVGPWRPPSQRGRIPAVVALLRP